MTDPPDRGGAQDVRRVLHAVNNHLLVAVSRVELARVELPPEGRLTEDLRVAGEALRAIGDLVAGLQDRIHHGAPSVSPAPRGGGQPVWVIDDQPMVVTVLLRQLERLGYTARGFSGGQAALAAAAAGGPQVALVDLHLEEEEDGVAVGRALRAAAPRCQVILMSGRALTPADGLPAGWPRPLKKPFEHAALARAIAAALEPE